MAVLMGSLLSVEDMMRSGGCKDRRTDREFRSYVVNGVWWMKLTEILQADGLSSVNMVQRIPADSECLKPKVRLKLRVKIAACPG